MEDHEIERWARRGIQGALKRQPREDNLLELKAGWCEPKKHAYQLAGHANAARGVPILWLFGVDQDKATVPGVSDEFSAWWGKMRNEFDDLAPSPRVLNLQHDQNTTVIAVLFETGRAPFVVKTHKEGKHFPQLEIPWRIGDSTEACTREQLLEILSPLARHPTVEVLDARLKVANTLGSGKPIEKGWRLLEWRLELDLMIIPDGTSQVCIISDKCRAFLSVDAVDCNIQLNKSSSEPERIMPRGHSEPVLCCRSSSGC